MWQKTQDVYCLEPKFTIKCPVCGSTKVLLRSSYIRVLAHNTNAWVDDRSYKCFVCSHCPIPFGRPIPADYAQKIIGLRGEPALSMRDIIKLWNRDKEVKKRLVTLGYV